MRKELLRGFLVLLAGIFVTSTLTFGIRASAQDPANQNNNANANSSPQNDNSAKRQRGTKRKASANANKANPDTGEVTPAETPAAQEPATAQAPAQAPETVTPTEQTDLSGTYAGTFDCAEAGLTGDTTLTITGNQFTTADGKTGRIVATTTRGYTGVALQVGETMASTPSATTTTGTTTATPTAPPMIMSLRARKKGERLTLTSVPGARHQCSFTPAGATANRRTRRRPLPAATGIETSNPATTTPEATTPVGPPTTPKRRSSRRASQNENDNSTMKNDNTGTSNSNSNSNSNTNANPVPTPSPQN